MRITRSRQAKERARALPGSLAAHTTITPESRDLAGDIGARIRALESIRNALDQAMSADPLGIRRYHVGLTIETIEK